MSFDRARPPDSFVFHPMKTLRFLLAGAALLSVNLLAAAGLHDIALKDLDGGATSLAPYKGKVMLIVNVASKCGLTPQYEALEALHRKHKDAGLVVLGFPCNQFGNQEPGSNAEIKEFCSLKFNVSFPMFDKLDVNGEHRHPLYVALAGKDSPFPGDIGWNFTKFIVGRDGRILHRFAPNVKPDAPEVIAALESALAAKS